MISAIKPIEYGKRFLSFIKRNVLLVDDQNRLLHRKLVQGHASRSSLTGETSMARSKLSQSVVSQNHAGKSTLSSDGSLLDHIGTSSSVSLLALSRSKSDREMV